MADPAPRKLNDLELSPGLVIEEAARRDSYTMLFFLIEDRLDKKVRHEFVEPADVTDQWIFDILSQEKCRWIMFRLTWGYCSLRIPEVAHQLQSQTKIIAFTAASGERKDFLALFDGFLTKLGDPREHATEFERAIRTSPKRLASQAEIDDALATVLRVAGCFSAGSTLKDYREAVASGFCLPRGESTPHEERVGRWLFRGSGLGGAVALFVGLLALYLGLIEAHGSPGDESGLSAWGDGVFKLVLFGLLGIALGGALGAALGSAMGEFMKWRDHSRAMNEALKPSAEAG